MMSQGSRCNIPWQKIPGTEPQDLQEHPKPLNKQDETSMSADECNALSIQTETILCPSHLYKCQAYSALDSMYMLLTIIYGK